MLAWVKFILVSIGQCIAFMDNGWNGAKASKYGNSGSIIIIKYYYYVSWKNSSLCYLF